MENSYLARQDRLRGLMEENRLQSFLVTNLKNLAYLTGFRGSAGTALVTSREMILWVDPRYTRQAIEQARGVQVLEERKEILKAVAARLKATKMRRAGYDDAHLSCAGFARLQNGAGLRVRLVPPRGWWSGSAP